METKNITFSTCYYRFNSKFSDSTYLHWIKNLFTLSKNNLFNLVIYTDDVTLRLLPELQSILPTANNVKIILKPIETFFTYSKDSWIKNHNMNDLLNSKIQWEVNMLWNEKINFVRETYEKQYFNTEFYAWCDIGYFRNRANDSNMSELCNWGSNISHIDSEKINYACVSTHALSNYLTFIHFDKGFPYPSIPHNQVSVAGGFFVLHASKIKWWHQTYYEKLKLYFDHEKLVKDDQIIVITCILENIDKFKLHFENSQKDNWFMFQRILNQT